MLADIAHQRSQSLLRQRKVLLLAAAASFVTNIALFSALSSKDREIVLQPIATRPLTISSSGVEADYLELVTRDVALMLLNRSPAGLDYWMEQILKLADPAAHGALMRRAFTLLEQDKGITLDLATIPQEDPATYAMIRRADTLGVFQIESRAQMASIPLMQPRTFYDLVIQVAIVRPGPIQGDMVHPYRRRRNGQEAVTYRAVRIGLRYVRDLKNADGAAIALARGEEPYRSVEEIQRRAGVSGRTLDRIGHADGFGSLELSRRSGVWEVKGLGDNALPLFAAADERDGKLRAEAVEPEVALIPMGEGEEVVEDYRTVGLSLRAHPLAFLRDELMGRRMITCASLKETPDGRWVNIAGIVLLRQKPGSAKGVMFITLEDETEVANLVLWPDLFEKHRRVVLGASMMGVRGRVQREGEVIHVVAQRLDDLSSLLASVGTRANLAQVYRMGRGDGATHGGGPDYRDVAERPLSKVRDIYIPDLRLGSGIVPGRPTEGIKVKPRDFR